MFKVLWHQSSMTKYISLGSRLKWSCLPLIFFILHLGVVELAFAICLWFGRRAAIRSSSSHRYAWTDMYCARAEALFSRGSRWRIRFLTCSLEDYASKWKWTWELKMSGTPTILASHWQRNKAVSSLNKTSGKCNICIRVMYSLKYFFIRQTCFLSRLPIYVIAVSGFFFFSVY